MSAGRDNHTSSPSDSQYLRISDRLSLRYQVSGGGPPLVLLHTIRTQLEYFRALVPPLAGRFKVFTVDPNVR